MFLFVGNIFNKFNHVAIFKKKTIIKKIYFKLILPGLKTEGEKCTFELYFNTHNDKASC